VGRRSRRCEDRMPSCCHSAWELNEMMEKSEKRVLIDACGVKCGAKLIEREGLPVDRYIELPSTLGIKKMKKLPSKDLENEVCRTIQKGVEVLLEKKFREEKT